MKRNEPNQELLMMLERGMNFFINWFIHWWGFYQAWLGFRFSPCRWALLLLRTIMTTAFFVQTHPIDPAWSCALRKKWSNCFILRFSGCGGFHKRNAFMWENYQLSFFGSLQRVQIGSFFLRNYEHMLFIIFCEVLWICYSSCHRIPDRQWLMSGGLVLFYGGTFPRFMDQLSSG